MFRISSAKLHNLISVEKAIWETETFVSIFQTASQNTVEHLCIVTTKIPWNLTLWLSRCLDEVVGVCQKRLRGHQAQTFRVWNISLAFAGAFTRLLQAILVRLYFCCKCEIFFLKPPPHEFMDDYGMHDDMAGGFGGDSPVLMVYGLNPDKMNCDRLFNIFCLYGNVINVSHDRHSMCRNDVSSQVFEVGHLLKARKCLKGIKMSDFCDCVQKNRCRSQHSSWSFGTCRFSLELNSTTFGQFTVFNSPHHRTNDSL